MKVLIIGHNLASWKGCFEERIFELGYEGRLGVNWAKCGTNSGRRTLQRYCGIREHDK